MTSRPAWFAETRGEREVRFAFRATPRGIIGWAERENRATPAEVRVVAPDGRESRLTFGGFWVTTDPRIAAALERADR